MNATSSQPFALQGLDLSRVYGGFRALDGVAISVPKGEVRGIIGPNGAGKSTLMDVLSGRAASWGGTVRLGGRDIGALSPRERRQAGLARSFQKTNVFAELTIDEQIRLAARSVEIDNSAEVLDKLELTALRSRLAADISYGDRRRLDLALALVGRPQVLLLDEPAAGLTVEESLAMARLLRDLALEWQVTVLLVEHDMEVVFGISNRITVLHLGKVLAEGTPDEIRSNPVVVSAYLGSSVE
ncbi:ABC transporter ATP-binding protein [Bosea lathyri]|uniref:Amino acid/amide ABC transporter ATP-binding protein 1, HAAT family (TC 3.A.1.4.-) n=1 Tax=Bosea lathyri TaxID=1036778 RepID=A0A1H5S504_9HYPH|nr:ABC transporter ATP-binding protein [Bosea lathyri]SEF45699.1 amino acid/amide ABC transporter ATP-binding protein 1, HAAT family (TC 3.A.1.4.-) [Bosea lathyri]